jgi:hypothetical protein
MATARAATIPVEYEVLLDGHDGDLVSLIASVLQDSVAPPRLYRQLGTVPQVAPLGEYGSAQGRGPGNDAGVRGPACGGCGHVDRLIT